MKIWRKRLTDSLNQLISDEAVYRTAPATPGLLKTINSLKNPRFSGNICTYLPEIEHNRLSLLPLMLYWFLCLCSLTAKYLL